MAINLTDNIRVGQQLPVDSRYFNGLLPWASLVAVTTGIPTALRFRGLTVNILGIEYWWADGILDEQLVIKIVDVTLDLQEVTDEGSTTTNSITAASFIKDGGFDFQFLKADGSVDNNTYLTSADLPSTLDLYATTSPDPVIAGYTALVRNITDPRYNTVAVDVPTPLVNGTIASPTFCGAVISDPSVLLGNPGVFNFTVIGNIRRTSGSTSSGADFFYSIYKRDLAGTETFIAESAKVPVPANGGFYIEYISTALWNDGIFLSTDRIVLKFYGIQTGGGTGAYYEFLFGGADPVRGTASISSAIIPNIYLRDLADVEKVPALNNEVLYWNDAASLWEHSLVVDLTPDASAAQRGLVSIGTQTFAGSKTFSSQTILGDGTVGTPTYGLLPQVTVGSATGGVFDIRNTSTNIVAGNTVGTLQFSAKDDDSVAYSTAQIKAITQNGIGTGSSGKTDLIFYTSNGSSSIERVKMNDLGLVINSEVTSTIASFDSNKSIKSLTTADGYPSLVELKHVKGVTSAIQTQLDGKAPLASPTFTGTVVLPSTTSIGNVSSTEIGYLDNVTSNIQTQLNGKQSSNVNLTSISGLTYSTTAFVKMTAAGTFTLDTSGGAITLSAIGTAPNANAATITGSVLNLQPADGTYGGVVTTGVQTFAGVKTFANNITASASIIATTAPTTSLGSYNILTRNTSTGVFEKLEATNIQPLVYNILIESNFGITTQTLGTNNGAEYSQDGRNVMINNNTTAIIVTATNASSSFIASYTKLSSNNITFATSGTLVAPYGAVLYGNAGSTALLTKNGTTVYLLVNNLL